MRLTRAAGVLYDEAGCSFAALVPALVDAAQVLAYKLSANVLKASADRDVRGALTASVAGQPVGPGGRRRSRALPERRQLRAVLPAPTARCSRRTPTRHLTGFLVDGDLATARQMVRYWFDDLQLANGSFPRNGLLNGKAAPDADGLQLDQGPPDPILANGRRAW